MAVIRYKNVCGMFKEMPSEIRNVSWVSNLTPIGVEADRLATHTLK